MKNGQKPTYQKSSSVPAKSYAIDLSNKKKVEFPTIIINDNQQGAETRRLRPQQNHNRNNNNNNHFAPPSTRDSLNLHSFFIADGKEPDYFKSNDSNDFFHDPVVIESSAAHGASGPRGMNSVKIHFTVPKLAGLVNLNKGPAKSFTAMPGQQNTGGQPTTGAGGNITQSNAPRPSSSNRGSYFTNPDLIFSFDDEDNFNVSPPKESKEPPHPTTKGITLSMRPAVAHHPHQKSPKHQHSSSSTKKSYIDPLTQERTYINEEQHQTIKENRSLKELLVDALEDFYIRNDQIPLENEYDVQTLQKAGIAPKEIQAIHEVVSSKKTQSIKPNLTTIQVTSQSNPATSRRIEEINNDNIPNKMPLSNHLLQPESQSGNNTARGVRFAGNINNNTFPLVYDVKQMFDDEIFPPGDPLLSNRSGGAKNSKSPNSARMNDPKNQRNENSNNQKMSREGKQRPSSANAVMVADMKQRLDHKLQQITKSTKAKKFFQPPTNSSNPEDMLYVNAKSYNNYNNSDNPVTPSSPHPQPSSPVANTVVSKNNPQGKSISPTTIPNSPGKSEVLIEQRAHSPRATTVMLLSHEILAKHEQQQHRKAFLPQTTLAQQRTEAMQFLAEQNVAPILEKKFNVPIIMNTLQPAGNENSGTDITHARNQRRLVQIIEQEAPLVQKLSKRVDEGTEKNESPLLPEDLEIKMKKQLSRYQEIVHKQIPVIPTAAPERNQATAAISAPSIETPLTDTLQSAALQHQEGEIVPDEPLSPRLDWKGFIYNPPFPSSAQGVAEHSDESLQGATNNTVKGRTKPLEVKKVALQAPLVPSNYTNSNGLYNPTQLTAQQHSLSTGGASQQTSLLRSLPHLHNDEDQDFMNVSSDLYLNDHLYYAEKQSSMRSIPVGNLSSNGRISPEIPDKQSETVKLNRHIPSERIDVKYHQSFHYPSSQSPLPIRLSSIMHNTDQDLVIDYGNHGSSSPNRHARKLKEMEANEKRLINLKIYSAKVVMAPKVIGQRAGLASPQNKGMAVSPTSAAAINQNVNFSQQQDFLAAPALQPAPPPTSIDVTETTALRDSNPSDDGERVLKREVSEYIGVSVSRPASSGNHLSRPASAATHRKILTPS